MILILSEESDHATNDVIDWLRYTNQDFLRINDSDVINIVSIYIGQNRHHIQFSVNNSEIIYSLNDFKSYWYRRGDICLKQIESKGSNALSEPINRYLKNETQRLREFFLRELDKIPNRIGSFFDLNNNKLSNLVTAAGCGLLIPDTNIVTEKKALTQLIKKPQVSKAIYNNFDIFQPAYHISSYTSVIEADSLPAEERLFPSLVQQFIDKQFDIRVFYLKQKMWAAAVFSQNDAQTQTDYRQYNDDKPNRIEAIELPAVLKKNIISFMTKLGMACGSLDFALGKDNSYYFLEVNPVGQFSSVSFTCGFNIEKAIAEELSKY